MSETDTALVVRARDGDRAAFEELVRRGVAASCSHACSWTPAALTAPKICSRKRSCWPIAPSAG